MADHARPQVTDPALGSFNLPTPQDGPIHMPYAPTVAARIELPERVAQSSSPATAEEIQAFFEDIFR